MNFQKEDMINIVYQSQEEKIDKIIKKCIKKGFMDGVNLILNCLKE